MKILLRQRRVSNTVALTTGIAFILYLLVALLLGRNFFLSGYKNFLFLFAPHVIAFTSNLNHSIHAGIYFCAFKDLDEGMLFGNAIFSYDIMSGLVSTGKGNGFELYHDGKVVATGNILPEDMRHLQEILEIREKYKEMLS
jgi:hypothetical protein